MYPTVRQFESSELHRHLVEKDAERARSRGHGLDSPQHAWVLVVAVSILVALVAALLVDGLAG